MAYVIPADFHAASQKWWCKGLTLEIADIPDADLTAVIAAVSARVDEWTFDHFETESTTTFYEDGWDTTRLFPHRRIQSLTTVSVKQYGGTYFDLDPGYYEVVSSISGGTAWIDGPDYVSVAYGRALPTPSGKWPHASAGVKLVGTFSWPACPDDIKRAVAALVWDEVKPFGEVLRRAVALRTQDGDYDMVGTTTPTGLPPIDRILGVYARPRNPQVL